MFILSLLLLLVAWVAAIILCWKFVLPRLVKLDSSVTRNVIVSVVLGGLLSPGLAVGHGAMLLPGGLATIHHLREAILELHDGAWSLAIGNLVPWLILSTVFFFRDP